MKQGRGGVFWNPWALKKTCRSVGPETWDLGQASAAFQAYDLEEERSLHLRIHPVAAMDVGMRHMWSAEEARGALTSLMGVVSDAGGHWMSCWHNTSVGEEPWQGWRATYHMVDAARHWG